MRRQISLQPLAHARGVHQHQDDRQRPAIVGPHGVGVHRAILRGDIQVTFDHGRTVPAPRPMVYNRGLSLGSRSGTRCRGALDGLKVIDLSRVLGGPYCAPDAGRPRRRGDQGRAAAGRRDAHLGPAVRPGRHLGLFRRHQPQQAHDRARPLQARGPRGAAEAARGGRRADREFQDRHDGEMGHRLCRYAREEIPAPGPCPRLGLRRGRAAGRLPRLRRHGAGFGRAGLGERRRPRAARCASACRWSISRPA